jgi:uncharacterized protein (DUF433 family)
MKYEDIITIEPEKRGGPCVRGLRITVYEVLDMLASGMSHAEILKDFPDLTEQDILACLAYAADRERKVELLKAGNCFLTKISLPNFQSY